MLCSVGAQVVETASQKELLGPEWGRRRSFAGEQLMGMDRPVTRNTLLIFRAHGSKKYFAMNLNLRAMKNSIFLKRCWPLLHSSALLPCTTVLCHPGAGC